MSEDKLCVNCRHCRVNFPNQGDYTCASKRNLVEIKKLVDLVTGDVTPGKTLYLMTCRQLRSESRSEFLGRWHNSPIVDRERLPHPVDYCGKEGYFWE